MSIPKRHHFVPEMLQKHFVDSDGMIHFFNKKTPTKGVQFTGPGNLLAQTHLYTAINADGSKDPSLELRYSMLEGVISPAIDEIVIAANKGRTPLIHDSTRGVLDLFIYEQMRRVPDFHEQIMPESDSERAIKEATTEYEQRYRLLSEEQKASLVSPPSIAQFRQNARVGALKRHSKTILTILAGKSLVVCRTRKKLSLLIGSQPVARSGGSLPQTETEVWLPIASSVAILYVGKRIENPDLYEIPDRVVRNLNIAIARKSTIFAVRSAKLVASMVERLALAK